MLEFFSPFVCSQNDKWTIKRKTGKGGKTERKGKGGGDSSAKASVSREGASEREEGRMGRRRNGIMEMNSLALLLAS